MVITVLLCFAKNNGLITALSASAYEKLLFDTSKVHTIDIVTEAAQQLIFRTQQ